MPHRACEGCGSYKGKQALDVSRDSVRTIAKAAARSSEHEHSHQETSETKETEETEEKAS
jgi:hypothetical protein